MTGSFCITRSSKLCQWTFALDGWFPRDKMNMPISGVKWKTLTLDEGIDADISGDNGLPLTIGLTDPYVPACVFRREEPPTEVDDVVEGKTPLPSKSRRFCSKRSMFLRSSRRCIKFLRICSCLSTTAVVAITGRKAKRYRAVMNPIGCRWTCGYALTNIKFLQDRKVSWLKGSPNGANRRGTEINTCMLWTRFTFSSASTGRCVKSTRAVQVSRRNGHSFVATTRFMTSYTRAHGC